MNTNEQIELCKKYYQVLEKLRKLSLLSISADGMYERDRAAYQVVIDRMVANAEIQNDTIDMLKRQLKDARDEIKSLIEH